MTDLPSWSLVVPTLNRPDVLRLCLGLAAQQTRPPAEIIVVDASDDWKQSRDGCSEELARCGFGGRLSYQAALERSSAGQRNQALQHATSEVVFLFDDDSLMFPDCAEHVLRVYAAFPGLGGVRASASMTPPVPLDRLGAAKEVGIGNDALARLMRIPGARWALRSVLMQDSQMHFIPYHGWPPAPPFPASALEKVGAKPERLFAGFLMTFRRAAIEGLTFEEALVAYAAGEDLDFTYRASLVGPLLACERALVYHHQAAGGRLPRDVVTTLSLLNLAWFVRKHSGPDLDRNRLAYRRRLARRLLAESLKDGLSRRFAFPQLKGLLRAARLSERVFALEGPGAAEGYRALQRAVVAAARTTSPSGGGRLPDRAA